MSDEQEKQPMVVDNICSEPSLEIIIGDSPCIVENIMSPEMVQSETTKDAMLESGLVRHARKELELVGMFDEDSDYGGMIGNSVMELIKVFAEQGHSGHSAGRVNALFHKLAAYQTICPLTGEDSEWNDVGGIGNDNTFQNNRNSAVFKQGKDGQAYYIDAIIWRTQEGMTYTGKTEEEISSSQFIKSFPFTPEIFYIDVIEEEVKKDDWIFRIKNMADLDKVWEVYDREKN